MDSSLSILGVIAFVLFHLAVTLPLAALTTQHLVWPWLGAQGLQKDGLQEWMVVVALFAVMAAAFALRAHVIGAGARHHPGVHPSGHSHSYQHVS